MAIAALVLLGSGTLQVSAKVPVSFPPAAVKAAPVAPGELRLSPAPDSELSEAQPTVAVGFAANSMQIDSCRLTLNNREVTANCIKAPNFISYRSFTPMESGPYQVVFHGLTTTGTAIDKTWQFTIKPLEGISALTQTDAKELGEFDDLEVRMDGLPGGQAYFEIENMRFNLPMRETTPGHYEGVYRVQPGDSALRAQVIGYLTVNGHTYEKKSPRTVAIWGNLFKIIVTEPKEDSVQPLNFKIKGRTRPNCTISIVPKIGFNNDISAATRNDADSDLGSIPCHSDAEGNFSADYGFIMKLPNLHIVLTLTAVDQKGQRSLPKVLRVKFK